MSYPPPESILPPAPSLSPIAKAAIAAFLITALIGVVGFSLSFYLAHGAPAAIRVLLVAVAWPALGVMVALGGSGLPEFLYLLLFWIAEYLYVWGVIFLVMKLVFRRHAAKRSAL